MNVYDLFRPDTPEVEERWLNGALNELDKPKTLTERNFVQVMLADRFQVQFKKTRLEAIERIAPLYAERFPLS